MSLSADVPKSGYEESMMTEQDRSLSDKAKDAFNRAAEKTKDFVHQVEKKLTGEGEQQDQAIRETVEQKQKLDRQLFESATAPPQPELAKCHVACACPECAYIKPVQQIK